MTARAAVLLLAMPATLLVALGACRERRAQPAPAPVYDGDVASLLARRCTRCHGLADAAAEVVLDSYLALFSCGADGAPAIGRRGDAGGAQPDAGTAASALLAVLERDDHADLLAAPERARLAAWLTAGAPLRSHGVHAPGILDPRSRDWHGRLAAVERYAPLRVSARADACGRCHDGAPVVPRARTSAAADAPACNECHREPEGVLACGTCHGDGASRGAPPRDRCLFPDAAAADAHRAHLKPPRLGGAALVCGTCHPAADAALRERHADGFLDVMFDRARAGTAADFELETRRCAVACHDRGGARARPRFSETGPLGCGDCHGAPPAQHYPGACDGCHAEANADGSALRATVLHLNGEVDVGDGDGSCGECHGQGDDPLPRSPSHELHRDSTLGVAIDCEDCHTVPEHVLDDGHLDRGAATPADVVFGARARAFAQQPSYRDGTCRDVACHGAGVGDDLERALRWDEPAAQGCSGCHGLPPAGDHPQDARCASTLCHGAAVSAGTPPQLTPLGRARHIDGKVDLAR